MNVGSPLGEWSRRACRRACAWGTWQARNPCLRSNTAFHGCFVDGLASDWDSDTRCHRTPDHAGSFPICSLKKETFIWQKSAPVSCCLCGRSRKWFLENGCVFCVFTYKLSYSTAVPVYLALARPGWRTISSVFNLLKEIFETSSLSLLLSQSSRKFLVWGRLSKLSYNLPLSTV